MDTEKVIEAMEDAIRHASPARDWVAIPHEQWRTLLEASYPPLDPGCLMEARPEITGRLYNLMADHAAMLVYIVDVGGEEFSRQMDAEIREAMDEHGVRVVLWYGERMQDCGAMMEEHLVTDG